MTLRFTWNGEVIPARRGDSIAAALTEAGIQVFGRSRTGRGRGHFCGMGVCQECIVVVDGQRSRRACMTEVEDGMAVAEQADAAGPIRRDPRTENTGEQQVADVAIVGAGPAGLNAALELREKGVSVTIIDERGEPGGQYFKPRSTGFRAAVKLDAQHRQGIALRARAAESGANFWTGETVWYARREDGAVDIRTVGPSGCRRLRARAIILATGALERPAIVPGWTLPGVMTIGAAQTLIRRYGVEPGRRILIAGHGPLGLQLGVEAARIGGDLAAVAERGCLRPGGALLEATMSAPGLVRNGIAYRLDLLRRRIPYYSGWELAEVRGDRRAEGAVLRRISDGTRREIDADVICAGDGFAPQTELARLLGVPMVLDTENGLACPSRHEDGSTDVPGVWIAGDAGGLGGASLAEAQGQIAAAGALSHLGHTSAPVPSAVARADHARRFQSALWKLYDAPPRELPADTVAVCRCEEVTAGAVRGAIAMGARDPGAVKRMTRLGMGRCQGRYCTAPVLRLLAESGHPQPPEALFAPQLPARPVPLAHLALEKPEWGGHRESSPGARPARLPQQPIPDLSTELLVIGAGVTGLSAALFAAREGARVLCLDRGLINGEASGGNAGSLHLQLLSWDFGVKAVAGGTPQLRTLPLQKESIALWKDLERDLRADFEMAVTGGLMVAENRDQIAFLDQKAAAEQRMGISTEVIGPERIREIVPEISDNIVAAAWCPGEGKINPLVASLALARAAVAAGARIEEQTPVTGMRRDGDGYEVMTPRGRITARTILIAAGGWSARIADLLGVSLPIRGAPLQMMVTETAPPLIPCLIAHADRHLTMKQTGSGNILIGGAWTAATGRMGQPLVLPDSVEGNSWVAGHVVPALTGLSVIRTWAAMNIDIDGAPLIGTVPGHPGVTVAATANGYTLGPLMGREAARIAITGRARQDLDAFSMTRFQ